MENWVCRLIRAKTPSVWLNVTMFDLSLEHVVGMRGRMDMDAEALAQRYGREAGQETHEGTCARSR